MKIRKTTNAAKSSIKKSIVEAASASDMKDAILKETEEHILAAIEALSSIASDNDIAKESIANLSVILLDLKSA